MQEYVTVAVTVAGQEEACARFLRYMEPARGANGAEDPRFSLNAWIPMPAPVKAAADRPEEPICARARDALAAAGAESVDDWRLRYWGSRSDAVEPEILVREGGTRLTITFGAPDSVPVKALQALAEAFPDLAVTARSYCPSWPRSEAMVFRPTAVLEPKRASA